MVLMMMMGTVYDVILHYQHTELSHHPGHRTDDSSTSSTTTTTTTTRVGSDQQQLEQALIVACHYRWGDEGGLLVDIGGGGGGWCDGEAAFTATILIFITIANELMGVDEPNTQQTPAYELNSHIYNRSHHTDR